MDKYAAAIFEEGHVAQVEVATRWWLDLTAAGGEGMVVKPFETLTQGRRFMAQPALKVRGREYLRIIYGPDYLMPENLARLNRRVFMSLDLESYQAQLDTALSWLLSAPDPRTLPMPEITPPRIRLLPVIDEFD